MFTKKAVRTGVLAAVLVAVGLTMTAAPAGSATRTALTVEAQAVAGYAEPDNTSPADLLVLVTNPVTGAAVTKLNQSNFVVIQHFSNPGMSCGFSNNVVTFNNVGTGAYHLQVQPKGCAWAAGEYLLQVMVTSGARRGQAAATLSVLSVY